MSPGAASWILCCCSLHAMVCAISVQGKSDYFLDSADRIHFFIEKSTADKDNGCRSHHVSILPIHLLQVGTALILWLQHHERMASWKLIRRSLRLWTRHSAAFCRTPRLSAALKTPYRGCISRTDQRSRERVGKCHYLAAFQVGHGLHVLAPWLLKFAAQSLLDYFTILLSCLWTFWQVNTEEQSIEISLWPKGTMEISMM